MRQMTWMMFSSMHVQLKALLMTSCLWWIYHILFEIKHCWDGECYVQAQYSHYHFHFFAELFVASPSIFSHPKDQKTNIMNQDLWWLVQLLSNLKGTKHMKQINLDGNKQFYMYDRLFRSRAPNRWPIIKRFKGVFHRYKDLQRLHTIWSLKWICFFFTCFVPKFFPCFPL
jgi:hypothetical protein